MKLPLRFEIWDKWEQIEQRDKSNNILCVELKNKIIAIHVNNQVKKYIYTVGMTDNEILKTYKSLRKAVKRAIELGLNLGIFNLCLDLSDGGTYIAN